MPRKSAKRPASTKKKTSKKTSAKKSPVKKTARKAIGAVKAAAKNPKRTVKKAAANVHETAGRARTLGDNIVTAGEVLKQTADVVDALAQRAARSKPKAGKKTSRR